MSGERSGIDPRIAAAGSRGSRIPLPTLLSWALIAFTIEFDNEFERRMGVRSTDHGGPRGPWGVSLRQWANFMRAVEPDGITLAELQRRTLTEHSPDGMRRWGYITVSGQTLRPTAAGRRAQAIWEPLVDELEQRWRERFGAGEVDALSAALGEGVARHGLNLPLWPTFVYGGYAQPPGDHPLALDRLPLYALISQTLHAFALRFEADGDLSLQYSANLIRLLGPEPTAVGELPARSGVALVSVKTALGRLAKRRMVTRAPAPGGGRLQYVRLTTRGQPQAERYRTRPGRLERGFAGLRAPLEAIVVAQHEALLDGLIAPPGNWRSQLPPIVKLPDHPMPRQGGHPDGT